MKSLTVIIPTHGNESLGSVPSLSGCRHYLMTRINCFIYTHIHIHMCTHTLSASGLFCGTALWSISQYEPCTGREDKMSQHTITGTPIVETLSSHTMDTRTHTHYRYMYVLYTVLCVAMKCVAFGKAGYTVHSPSSPLPSGTFPVSPFGRDTLRKHLLRDKLCRMEFCKGREGRPSIQAQLQGNHFQFHVHNTTGISNNKHSLDANTPCPVQHSHRHCWMV